MSQAHARTIEAEALFHQGHADKARQLLTRVLQQRPGDAEACNLMALMLGAAGEDERALVFAERAYATNPRDWRFINNLSHFLTRTGKRARAMEVLARGVQAAPGSADVRAGYAGALSVDSQFVAAAEQCRAGLRDNPGNQRLLSTLGTVLIEMGESEEAVRVLREGLEHNPDDPLLASLVCMGVNYLPRVSAQAVLADHRRFGEILRRRVAPAPLAAAGGLDPERRLRVALVSGDLRTHSVSYFIEPFLERHDRERFEVVCYHTNRDDAVSARLRGHAARWTECGGWPEERIADAIRAGGHDIALELSGHTCTATMAAMHRRVAPVQCTYLGYPNTTGVDAMGWRFVDSTTDPPGEEDRCVERLARLDPCFLCYRPPAFAPPMPAGDGSRGVRFGSFNTTAKLSPDVLRTWVEILDRVPGSALVLKASSLVDPRLREQVAGRMAGWGLDPSRLQILAPAQRPEDHLALYAGIDIALDPFPYNGTTTTCEALWMGVPVVTLAGDRHCGRVGASLLRAAGLGELVAADLPGYVDLACSLASDRQRLGAMRPGWRDRLSRSALLDEAAHTRRLEAALRGAWRARCESPA